MISEDLSSGSALCKTSIQIHWNSREIYNEAPTTSSHMLGRPLAGGWGMWEEVVGASLLISKNF